MEEKLLQLQAKCEADQDFVQTLFSFDNPEEVQSFLNENGLDFSIDDVNEFKQLLDKVDEMGELSDDALEDVAGGGAVATTCAIVGALHTVTDGKSTSTAVNAGRSVANAGRSAWRAVRRRW